MNKKQLLLHFVLLVLSTSTLAQLSPMVDSIPMRDGKKLAVDIYVPSGCSQCPTILIQTPYNRLLYRWSLPLGIGLNLNNSNYNFAIVDWRGFYGSTAAFDANADRGEDGYDVVDWISNQSWSDGQVGTWGPSALGVVQFQTAREKHPNHVCAVPQVAGPQFNYEDYYYGGVLEASRLEQLDALGYGLSPLILSNQTYNFLWQFSESGSFYPADMEIPFLMIGGWYDHNVEGMLEFFNAMKQSSPLAVRDQHKLLMGPWVHGGTGAAYVGSSTQGELTFPEAEFWSDSLALDFFDYYMRGISNNWNNFPNVKYFQIGENVWNDNNVWPPTDVSTHQLYLHPNNLLLGMLPSNSSGSSGYNYDPRAPSPTIGGPTLHSTLDQGSYDQAPLVESRNDVLTFSSVALSQNVVMKGNSKVHLYVSSNLPDTDFAIRLTDVYPDNRSMLLTDGIQRMRFRNGYTASDTVGTAMTGGQIYEVEIELPTLAYTFLAGHKIRIDITSSNARRWDVNLNNGGDMYVAGDTLIAQNTVYFNSNQPSYVELQLQDFLGQVDAHATFATLALYPNPARETISIDFVLENEENISFALLDMQGKVLEELGKKRYLAGTHKVQIGLNTFANGMYFVSINTPKGRIVKKIAVIK